MSDLFTVLKTVIRLANAFIYKALSQFHKNSWETVCRNTLQHGLAQEQAIHIIS
jgi:hypothetical protein